MKMSASTQKQGEQVMGGTNQATCPAPSKSVSSGKPVSGKSIRYHEDTPNGEVHFHDDAASLRCAIPSGSFFTAYGAWRKSKDDELTLFGTEKAGGPAKTHFHIFPGIDGILEVAITVEAVRSQDLPLGSTLDDLDLMAGFTS